MVEQIRGKLAEKKDAQKKKANAAAKAAKVSKRPAGATSQILKRPASAMSADGVWQRYPGVPSAGVKVNPITVPGYGKIYTAHFGQKWRCQKQGEKIDHAFSWKDPKESWARLVAHVKSNML